MTRYAVQTDVAPERTQGQISEVLRRYGATGFAYGWEGHQAMVAFVAHGRQIRFLLPLPHPDERRFTVTKTGQRRTASAAKATYEQEIRSRWRALLLAIKAKLEAVETQITTFEQEFMAHIVLPDGSTVGDHVLAEVEQAYRTGGMPPSLLPATRPALEAGHGGDAK